MTQHREDSLQDSSLEEEFLQQVSERPYSELKHHSHMQWCLENYLLFYTTSGQINFL